MPNGMESSSQANDAPLDGVAPPSYESPSVEEKSGPLPETPQLDPTAQKKILLIIIGVGGTFLLFTLFFALYLLVALPDPEGGRQGLKAFGNLFFVTVSLLSVLAVTLIGMRMIRSGLSPDELPRVLMRPVIAAAVILGISGMVFVKINATVPLAIDILEPKNTQGLVAPITITFGTDSLRQVLRNQKLSPKQYKWDFNGDGTADAETQEHEVTTVYKRKGTYVVRMKVLLSNGTVREAGTRLTIPSAVFSFSPEVPILKEDVTFDASNLVDDPKKIENIEWDFNGDGTADQTIQGTETSYAFPEIGTFQIQAIVQYIGGLRETTSRTVTILPERQQPFTVSIETEGALKGSIPLGLIFQSKVEEGINTNAIEWRIGTVQELRREQNGERKSGERISHVFNTPGDYRVILTVTDSRGRISTKSIDVSVLEPLLIKDIVLNGTPKPTGGKAEGLAPLEVHFSAATSAPFISFEWEQENASTVYSTKDTYHAIYEDPGKFPVVLIARDEQGRTQKIPIEVSVQPPRSRVAFTAVPATGIAPLNVTFDASESFVPDGRITGFSWTFGDSETRDEKPQLLGAKVTHRYEKEGTFTVMVRALTEDGRSFEARKTIVVRSPTLNACIFPSRITGNAPMGVRFDAGCSTGSIAKYVWTFGDGATSDQTEPIQDHVFEKPGAYTVLLEISDGQGNFDQTTVTITVGQ